MVGKRTRVATDVDRLADIAALGEFAAQHFFRIGFSEQLGLEVQAGERLR